MDIRVIKKTEVEELEYKERQYRINELRVQVRESYLNLVMHPKFDKVKIAHFTKNHLLVGWEDNHEGSLKRNIDKMKKEYDELIK